MYEVPSIAAAMQNARMPYSELGHGFVVARSPGPPLVQRYERAREAGRNANRDAGV